LTFLFDCGIFQRKSVKSKGGFKMSLTLIGLVLSWMASAFKLVSPEGKVILIDPWLTNPSAPPDSLKKLENVDLILITHGHSDHIGNAIEIAKEKDAEIISIFEVMLYLQSKGLTKLHGMNKGGTIEWNKIKITMTDAVHSSGIDENGKIVQCGGEPAGYVITFENGFTVYHAGDTGIFRDMELIRELYHPELALLPIGSVFTMGPEEASFAIVNLLKPEWAIPMHYGTFPVLSGTPEKLIELLPDIYKERIIVLNPGETAE